MTTLEIVDYRTEVALEGLPDRLQKQFLNEVPAANQKMLSVRHEMNKVAEKKKLGWRFTSLYLSALCTPETQLLRPAWQLLQ
ncbi:hypothetical protein [Nitrososphaera viennensis]|uniref:Uncharacterized protein n=2 Tax=Nitrososphaera viennensis TaxID=1034015 RepID=A0A060HLW9_9ARCH|nr:hypothetical protein [Nitrososphaera viennensis]AIC14576.1 hypothetical protein NVIE_0388 [Nitrososphaera viennensis EN76]UVS69544.1 hypothetical protein NWT39_01870 [Nitrososphaera viennensis]